jgi:sec-independent protein translocase protein TatA
VSSISSGVFAPGIENLKKEYGRMSTFGWPEILIILVIVVLIFGVGKVADVGPALGKTIRGFREAMSEDDEGEAKEAAESSEEES